LLTGVPVRLFAGDDSAEDHHDVEMMDEAGKVLARRRLPEGVAGMTRLHELIGRFLPEDAADAEVVAGIETDRGPWVAALITAGYAVFPVNPLQASRHRERHGVAGAKSDGGDAHMLAGMVRTDSRQLRPAAGDGPEAEGIKVLARTHKTLIWERTRAVQRLRHQLREYFPAALEAFEDLGAPDTLELLGRAPDPARAAKPTRAQVSAALKRARRRDIPGKMTAILAALRSEQLGQPPAVTAAYAAATLSLIALIVTLNEQVKALQGQVAEHFGQHPDAEIYQPQPGMGAILGARVLAEFGDDPHRYADGKARRNYAATSPITRASGKEKVVAARFVHNDRLVDALRAQAFAALNASPGARAFYDAQRAKGLEHNDALRRLASRLAGILHGCLKTRALYDEATAWGHRENGRCARKCLPHCVTQRAWRPRSSCERSRCCNFPLPVLATRSASARTSRDRVGAYPQTQEAQWDRR
jgi:Transposase/Transposase IS116/IS110/IS902 family